MTAVGGEAWPRTWGDQNLNANCPWVEGDERGREGLVLAHGTNITSVLLLLFFFFSSPSSPERQLSDSFKCVKPNC